jgi:hypothetical protein
MGQKHTKQKKKNEQSDTTDTTQKKSDTKSFTVVPYPFQHRREGSVRPTGKTESLFLESLSKMPEEVLVTIWEFVTPRFLLSSEATSKLWSFYVSSPAYVSTQF